MARFLRDAGVPADPTPIDDASIAPLRVLVIDDGAHRTELIRDELERQGHQVVGVGDSALLVHDCVLSLGPDVVIVDSESPSRDTLEHLAAVNQASPRPVVVFAEDASPGPMQQALRSGVAAYVIAGLQPQRLTPVLQVAIARFAQDRELRAQLDLAQTQLTERRTIEHAKRLLMEEIGLTEAQAHAHLRRMAMDRGQKIAEVAERVAQARDLLKPRS